MKKISVLLAALILSVTAYAQQASDIVFKSPTDAAKSATVQSKSVVAANGEVTVTTPDGVIKMVPTNTPGEFKVVSSTVKSVPQGFVTQGTAAAATTTTAATAAGISTGFVVGGTMLLVTTMNQKTGSGTTVTTATTGSI